MIDGVQIKNLVTHNTPTGFFRELLRCDDKIFKEFGQVALSTTKAGEIKAFHWHKEQDDIFYVLHGKAKIVLHDLRGSSPTFKHTEIIIMSEDEPMLVLIPRGVAHGYQVLGDKTLTMLYFMNKAYNPNAPDEQRIPYNEFSIGYKW